MKILIVIDRLAIGGAELLMVNLARQFEKKGITPFFCGLGNEGKLIDILEKNNFKYFSCNANAGVRIKVMVQLYQLIKSHRIDIILTNHFRQLFHSFIPSLLTQVPIVHVEHDLQNYLYSTKNCRRLSWMSRRIKAFVAISHSLSDWFIAQSPPLRCPVEIIPNGIDTNHFAPISRQQKSQLLEQRFPGAAKKTFILGTCARLEAIKNIEFMIEIFAVFNKKHPDTMLILIGDGSRRHHLEELAIAHHVQDHILFVGLIEDVYQWLPLFDLYLITSFDEGLPLSVLEAMSCNIPVIANSVGELPSIITPETGKLTQTLAVKEWIDILEDFYNSTKASESPPISGGRRAAQSSYSINSCVDSYLHLLLN